jgi:lipid A disaccharide synthetase
VTMGTDSSLVTPVLAHLVHSSADLVMCGTSTLFLSACYRPEVFQWSLAPVTIFLYEPLKNRQLAMLHKYTVHTSNELIIRKTVSQKLKEIKLLKTCSRAPAKINRNKISKAILCNRPRRL